MSTKPVQLPQWATDGTNNTEPSLAQKQTGWTPGQDGVSDYDNWFKRLVYDWLVYVNDGDVDLHDVHITGTLEVDGAAQFDGAVTHNADVDIGTHKLTHGDHVIPFPLQASADLIQVVGGSIDTPSHTNAPAGSGGAVCNVGTTSFWRVPPVAAHERLKSIQVQVTGTGSGMLLGLYYYNALNETYQPLAVAGGGGSGSAFVSSDGAGLYTLTPAALATNVAERSYVLVTGTVSIATTLRSGRLVKDVV